MSGEFEIVDWLGTEPDLIDWWGEVWLSDDYCLEDLDVGGEGIEGEWCWGNPSIGLEVVKFGEYSTYHLFGIRIDKWSPAGILTHPGTADGHAYVASSVGGPLMLLLVDGSFESIELIFVDQSGTEHTATVGPTA